MIPGESMAGTRDENADRVQCIETWLGYIGAEDTVVVRDIRAILAEHKQMSETLAAMKTEWATAHRRPSGSLCLHDAGSEADARADLADGNSDGWWLETRLVGDWHPTATTEGEDRD